VVEVRNRKQKVMAGIVKIRLARSIIKTVVPHLIFQGWLNYPGVGLCGGG